jgi:hypothetical protein
MSENLKDLKQRFFDAFNNLNNNISKYIENNTIKINQLENSNNSLKTEIVNLEKDRQEIVNELAETIKQIDIYLNQNANS